MAGVAGNFFLAGKEPPADCLQHSLGMAKGRQDVDYRFKLYEQNGTIQTLNNANWNSQRRQGQNKGGKIEKAY